MVIQWFKHESAANNDAKLKKLRMKYGLEGYGLYWYCLELVASNVTQKNITFELEHDAEILSFDLGIHQDRIAEMMGYMVDLGLFESTCGVVTCLSLAKRADEYTAKALRIKQCKINDLAGVPIVSGQYPDSVPPKREEKEEKKLDKKKVIKPESFKQFFIMYPPNKKGGTDATAWKKAKGLGFTDNEFNLMIIDIEQRKALMPKWYETYAIGITKYLEERIWLTPITPEKQDINKFEQNVDALQNMQFAPQQNNGLLNHD
jgi:hypothetical protein